MAILIKSKTPEADRNFWSTQWGCFLDAQRLHGRSFRLDVAAEPLTAKCNLYYARPEMVDELLDCRTSAETKRQMRESGAVCVGLDALLLPWEDDWWCNPPFDLKEQFIIKAKREQAKGHAGMMLLPYEPLTNWWRDNLAEGVIVYEPDGRYNFMERDGKTRKSGANFGSVLVSFPSQHIGRSPRIPFIRGR